MQNYTLDRLTLGMLFNKRMREEGYKFDNPFFGKVIIEQFLDSIIEDTELRRAISEGRDSRILISKLVPPVKEDKEGKGVVFEVSYTFTLRKDNAPDNKVKDITNYIIKNCTKRLE